MAGLNFYTQTLINVNEDADSKKKSPKFEGVGTDGGLLRIKRDFNFYKAKEGVGKILKITTASATDPELAYVEIDATKLKTALDAQCTNTKMDKIYCRLDVYIGVEGAEPYIYSTPWVQKGMPFWIEFTFKKGDTAKVICDTIVEAITKNHIFLCDKDLIEVTDNDSKITLKATSDYQRFRKVTISAFNTYQDDADVIAELDKNTENSSTIQLKAMGKAGFGTYSHIIKDLRLPTAANYQWSHIRQEETPIVGATYNEYIIEYEAPSTNEGLGAVGQKLNSVTTHVFWVNTAIAKEFEAALTAAQLTFDSALPSPEAANVKVESGQKSPETKTSKVEGQH